MASIIAIDGPLVRMGADEHIHPMLKRFFIRGSFTTGANAVSVIMGWDSSLDGLQAMLALNLVVSLPIRCR